MGSQSLWRACQTEIVSYGRTGNHAEDKDGGIPVAFTGHEKLTPRAASGKTECQAGKGHTRKIPDMHRMGNGLLFKTGMELTDDDICDKGGTNEGDKTAEEMGLAKEDKVTYGSHSAESASLGKKSHGKADNE